MSLLDKASLIVTPNGFKASKLYSVVPSDGSGDMTVTRATTATRVNSSGLIESVANNVPRLDYLNSTCPSLLVEQQRTNVQTYSEDFSNVVYIKVGATVTTNTTVAPDGATTGDFLKEDSTTGIHTAAISAGQGTSGDYTFSVFVKANGRTKFQLAEAFSIGGNVNFDLTAGTATTTAPAKNGRIENYGNGWFKCSATWAFTAGATTVLYLNLLNNSSSNSYAGDNTSGVVLWGAQLEAGSYSTSYIPTTTASVTRNVDAISKTGITSLIGQTEGTLFAEFNLTESFGNDLIIASLETSGVNSIQIRYDRLNTVLRGQFYNGSTYIGVITTTAYSSGIVKVAYTYKSGTIKLFVNGTLIGTSSSTFSGQSFNSLGLNALWNTNFIDRTLIKSVQVYKTQLSDTECTQLTTI